MLYGIKEGITYRGGTTAQADSKRKVITIERRSSGSRYVNWVRIKKNGTEGAKGWTRLYLFEEWAKEEVMAEGDRSTE